MKNQPKKIKELSEMQKSSQVGKTTNMIFEERARKWMNPTRFFCHFQMYQVSSGGKNH